MFYFKIPRYTRTEAMGLHPARFYNIETLAAWQRNQMYCILRRTHIPSSLPVLNLKTSQSAAQALEIKEAQLPRANPTGNLHKSRGHVMKDIHVRLYSNAFSCSITLVPCSGPLLRKQSIVIASMRRQGLHLYIGKSQVHSIATRLQLHTAYLVSPLPPS